MWSNASRIGSRREVLYGGCRLHAASLALNGVLALSLFFGRESLATRTPPARTSHLSPTRSRRSKAGGESHAGATWDFARFAVRPPRAPLEIYAGEARVVSEEHPELKPDVGGRGGAHLHQAGDGSAPKRPPSPRPYEKQRQRARAG